MKRAILVLMLLFISVGWSSAGGSDNKYDRYLEEKVKKLRKAGSGKSGGRSDAPEAKEKIRVIIQNENDDDDEQVSSEVRKNQGKVNRKFKIFSGNAVEIDAETLEKLPHSKIKRMSLDAEVRSGAIDAEALLGLVDVNRTVTGGPSAWLQYGATGKSIGVAVIDSGIAPVADLRISKTVDFTDKPMSGDPYGHGTHVAGILAGRGHGFNYKYLGIAPDVNVVNLRVLDNQGVGYTSDVIQAIEWAVANRNAQGNDGKSLNIRIINLSLGHLPYEEASTDPLTVACRKAVAAGMIVVASAGNYGKDAKGQTIYGGITSPGTEPSVITVGAMTTWDTATRSDDKVATYSSRGPTRDGLLKPDVMAPGSQIVAPKAQGSTLSINYPQLSVGSDYIKLSGTSMSAPMVAGIAALMLDENPYLTPNSVKAILMYTAEKRGSNPLDTGAGYINGLGAVNLAANVNAQAGTSQYWLINSGSGVKRNNTILGQPVVWSETIVWGDALRGGPNAMSHKNKIFGSTIVWGDQPWVQDFTIVWDVLNAFNMISGQTIVWDLLDAFTSSGQTIVWDILNAFSYEEAN